LTHPRTVSAAWKSVILSLGAGVLVALLGVSVAVARQRLGPSGRALETSASWPYAVPGTVVALALISTFSQELRVIFFDRLMLAFSIANSLWLLLVAYAAKHLALGTRGISEALAQVDPTLEEAARVLGAKPARAFVTGSFAFLKPAVAAAFLLAALTCATELSMSVLLVPTGQEVLGTLLFEWQTYADPASASVLACALIVVVMVAFAPLTLTRRTR
jgi:iron(III) transport system permease protein